MKTIIPDFEIASPYEEDWTPLEKAFIEVENIETLSSEDCTYACLQILADIILEERKKAAS